MEFLFAIIIAFLAGFIFIALTQLTNLFYDNKERMLRKKYPEYYIAVEARDKILSELLTLREDYEIIPKEHIDTLILNEKYVSLVDRAHYQEQLEYWRQIISEHAEEIQQKEQEYILASNEVSRLKHLYKINP